MAVDVGILPVFSEVVSPLVEEVLRQRDDFLADPTSLCAHDFRRALRRLHACLDMFGNLFTKKDRVRLLRELDALTRKLGPTRDLDVLLDRQFAKAARESSHITSNNVLEIAVRKSRSAAAAKAQRAVRSARFALLLGSMRSALVELTSPNSGMSLSAEVVGWLIHADAKVRKSGSKLSKLSDSRKHSLRARVKALKYNSDVFLRLYAPNSGVQYRAALNDLHDVLGTYSDGVTCANLMRELHFPERERKDGHRHVSKRDSTDKRLKKVWSEFEHAPRPWSSA